jgi:hypothetical protein
MGNMTLQERLVANLAEAMKKGDRTRRSVIRLVRAGVVNAEIAQQRPLDDGEVLRVIQKEVREHRDSISEFKKANRLDLVAKVEAELAVLLEYLPQQMSWEEIEAAARQVIEEVGARGPRDKGKVMPKLVAQLRGRAEGREINTVVSELLDSLSGS